ncbi:DUF6573 family protein [Actinomadura sp. WMMA1423]|uniref:DUF6573 family protein n=1 Tax=Actinomadura sp. WMMA1423 TaxID=2591108 RepID=UPI001146F2CE|nr:DUF6573 family protein [Actinomadura sp. WMMA1423]
MNEMEAIFGPVIHAHTRADAIEAGDLVEAKAELVRDARLHHPVALTRAAWLDCVAWTDADTEETGAIQDEDGRLFDVLTMTRVALIGVRGGEAVATVHRIPRGERFDEDSEDGVPAVYLAVTVETDDEGRPCITVSQIGED